MASKSVFPILSIIFCITTMFCGSVAGELITLDNDEMSEITAKAGPVSDWTAMDESQDGAVFDEEDLIERSEFYQNEVHNDLFQDRDEVINYAPSTSYQNYIRFPSCSSGGCGR